MKAYYKRYLPHLTPPGGIFFITSVLKGALPAPIIIQLQEEKKDLIEKLKKGEKQQTNAELRENLIKAHKAHFLKVDRLLDQAEQQVSYLKNPACANILTNKIKQYDGEYYELVAYCIMSNHFHLLIDTSLQLQKLEEGEKPTRGNYIPLSKIMQLIKGGSSFEINQRLGRKGTLWQIESYDHLVRNEKEYLNIHQYILNNPVKAGLVSEWKDYSHSYSKYHDY